ncbi:MAG: hypothetical protein LUC37_02865 [Prevotella sp.]|nr:hypothetical protein [Prevotella sp.]
MNIDDSAIDYSLKRLTNQIYKLLPTREEQGDWEKPLETIIEELVGMDRLLIGKHNIIFPLLCKLEGLFSLTEEDNFLLFRRTIFDCLSLMNSLKKSCH